MNEYLSSAYNSGRIPELPEALTAQARSRTSLMKSKLRWGHYASLQPWIMVDGQLRSKEHTFLERTKETTIYCNHRRWLFEGSSNFLQWMMLLKILLVFCYPLLFMGAFGLALDNYPEAVGILAGVLLISSIFSFDSPYGKYFFYIPALLAALLIAIHFRPDDEFFDWVIIPFILGFTSYFAGTIGIDILIGLYLKHTKHDGSEFNRQDGMVRVARRFGRKMFVAPFYEFDAVLEVRTTRHASSYYCISLIHRYTDFSVFLGGKVHPIGMGKEDALAFWDTLQRYMDVTQPLPDLPVLEQSRHLDPVTQEHDLKAGRKSRYWRDMKLNAWNERLGTELIEKLQSFPWQSQPCILQERIHPDLRIADYYHAQEAKGIVATPKAKDFENDRRSQSRKHEIEKEPIKET